MKEETKKQIYQYLQKYLNQKQEHSEYIDYYELCNLNENMTIEQLQKEIKQKELTKLFHPDQEGYLDDEFQGVFRECSNKIGDMKNIFSNQQSKDRYDKELKEQKAINEELEKRRASKENTTNWYQKKDDISITMEEKRYLERAIETTIYKFGFYQGYIALQKTLSDDFSMVTKENHARDLLKQVGTEKIRKIIEAEETDIMERNPNNVVMDYYCKIINKSGLQEKAEVFYNACLQTALKYDLNGNCQTDRAISSYIEDLNMNGFTNQNVDKQELCKLSPQDFQLLMCVKMHSLGKENPNYLFSNFSQQDREEQIKVFSETIKKEARNIANQRKAM